MYVRSNEDVFDKTYCVHPRYIGNICRTSISEMCSSEDLALINIHHIAAHVRDIASDVSAL